MDKELLNLSVVLPLYNAHSHIENLITTISDLHTRGAQIVLIDDCSTDGSSEKIFKEFERAACVTTVKLNNNGGAGTARNIGLKHIERAYTLFFDVDDHLSVNKLTAALRQAMTQKSEVQIARFSCVDSQGKPIRSNIIDEEIFDHLSGRFGETGFNFRVYPRVLRLTNYPWNKLLKTEFMKRTGFRFGATRVQNDVFAHWSALLKAQKVTFFDSVYATHLISAGAVQITNDFGGNRLQMFDALEEVERELLCDEETKTIAHSEFLAFKTELILWAKKRMKQEFYTEFAKRAQSHALKTSARELLEFNSKHPRLAALFSKNIAEMEI